MDIVIQLLLQLRIRLFKMLIKSFILILLFIFISIVEANVAPKLQPIIPKFFRSLENVNYRIETLGDDDSMLIMERLGSNDSGNYSCIVRNSYGMDRQRIQIIVTGLSQNFS